MRRLSLLIVISLLFLTGTLFTQAIQEYVVADLSGGLVNSIDNALMQDNQWLVGENYDLTTFGLKRRGGFSKYNVDALDDANYHINAVFPYQAKYTDKDFLVLRSVPAYWDSNLVDTFIMILVKCDETSGEETCSTYVAKPFFSDRRSRKTSYNINSQTVLSRLLVSVTNSELTVYDGNKAFPARPRAPGQPIAVAMDGGGSVNGIVTYRFLFKENGGKQSNLSPPSWPVSVQDGIVFLSDLGPTTSATFHDSIVIYRSLDGGTYQALDTVLGFIAGTYIQYIDRIATTSPADTLAFPWGPRTNCIFTGCGQTQDTVPSPGAISIATASVSAPYGINVGLQGLADSTCAATAYSIVYIDSAGRQSYASTPNCRTFGDLLGGNATIKAILTNIPVPRDSGIVSKLLLKCFFGNIDWEPDSVVDKQSRVIPYRTGNLAITYVLGINGTDIIVRGPSGGWTAAQVIDSLVIAINSDTTGVSKVVFAEDSTTFLHLISNEAGVGWVVTNALNLRGAIGGSFEDIKQRAYKAEDYIYGCIIRDTLHVDSTTYTDSLPYDSLDVTRFCTIDSSNPQEPTTFCYDDSNITFQPFDIAYHGDRLFAIGDLTDKNALWYSDFGRPTTYPSGHFFSVESQSGDWFVKILSVGNILILFRQNSIYTLSGLSFFQFQLNQVVFGVGLTAPRSVAHSRNVTFFAHQSGVYTFPMQPNQLALSWPIQNTIDSVGESMRRAVGRTVGREYWFSVAIGADSAGVDTSYDNNRTLIYSNNPKPHWKAYSFGIRDIALFDEDTLSQDYSSDKFIFVGQSDSMYKWNYSPLDTLDDTTHITATYQSKYFFHEGKGPVRREKIFYVDFFGTGVADTMVVRFYEETRGLVDSVRFVPDFTDNRVDRVVFNRTSDNFSLGWRDNGQGDYIITGYTIGWLPWDSGRKQ